MLLVLDTSYDSAVSAYRLGEVSPISRETLPPQNSDVGFPGHRAAFFPLPLLAPASSPPPRRDSGSLLFGLRLLPPELFRSLSLSMPMIVAENRSSYCAFCASTGQGSRSSSPLPGSCPIFSMKGFITFLKMDFLYLLFTLRCSVD